MSELAERRRQATVDHLAEAAWQGMVDHGLDVTVEEIAHLAGVSRRTVFRHVATRDELLAEAVRRVLPRFDADLPQLQEGDWQTWLRELCQALHRANTTFGRILWELRSQPNLSPALTAVAAEIQRYRHERNLAVAVRLWGAAGLTGPPSTEFQASVLTHLGPVFTTAVRHDAGGSHQLAATLAESAMVAAVATASSAASASAVNPP